MKLLPILAVPVHKDVTADVMDGCLLLLTGESEWTLGTFVLPFTGSTTSYML